jgi:GT2 family glycosyltransferase
VNLSILIANWNTKEILAKCLESIYIAIKDLKELSIEIIVVDNGSNDGSQKMVKTDFPNVTLIENKKNVGFGGAINQAASVAKSPLLLVSNADVIYSKEAIKMMIETINSDKNYTIVAPKLVVNDSKIQPSAFRFPTLLRLALEQLFVIKDLGLIKIDKKSSLSGIDTIEVDWVLGASFMIRTDVYREVTGFCEEFFMYWEETDLCFRVKKKGFKIVILPDVKVVHIGRASTSQISDDMIVQQTMSLIHYFYKNHGSCYAKIARIIILLGQLSRLVFFKFISLITFNKSGYKKRVEIYKKLIKALLSYRFNQTK